MLQRVYTPEGLLLETACEVKTLKIAVKDTQQTALDIKTQLSKSELHILHVNAKLGAISAQITTLCDAILKLDNRVKALENKK